MCSLQEQKIEDTGKVDYEAESTPPTDFAQRAFHDKILTASVARSKPERILKMGVSGLLGRHLLNHLLDRPMRMRNVVCVAVRDLAARLIQLRQGDRVPYFEGDLREPRLGLSEADGVPILGQVDAATHNGADTSHLQALP